MWPTKKPMQNLSPETLEQLKAKLLSEQERIKKDLQSIASKDPNAKEEWDSKFPQFDADDVDLEDAASEVEEYATRLPIEQTLELRLQAIDAALQRMGAGTYGICENCHKAIDERRLMIYPEAKYCLDCGKRR